MIFSPPFNARKGREGKVARRRGHLEFTRFGEAYHVKEEKKKKIPLHSSLGLILMGGEKRMYPCGLEKKRKKGERRVLYSPSVRAGEEG